MSDEKYDGWAIKILGKHPILCTGFFFPTRKQVIEKYERLWGLGSWRRNKKKKGFKIVKIKLVEVAK